MLTRRQFAAGVAAASLIPTAALRAATPDWSSAGLDAFRRQALELGVRGLVVNSGGKTILSDGDVSTPWRIASIRKSFVSALFGIAAADGKVDLAAKIGDLGVEDYTPLTETERSATVRQLLQARSGIYLPTAAESAAMKAARPARGSQAPGSFWYYNNWDFNALGEIYQRLTGEDLFVAIEHRLLRPLGFEDFDPLAHARWAYDPSAPRFPAYNLWMSARDLVKFGQLFLDGGQHRGRQLVPAAWIAESTRSYSDTGRTGLLAGYGYMWWVATAAGGPIPQGTYSAVGNGGRYVVVMPALGTVVAIQPDEKSGQPPVPLYADRENLNRLIATLVAAAKPIA
jgi:CubicO group peptidase (beta-lactamase class C family)